jgi:tetratricopeptide (TPR) repeat protein
MSKTCWEFLGIKETVDQLAIRRAYTHLLRKHNPEEDAEAFQALRTAYEEALKQSRYLSKSASDDPANKPPEQTAESTATSSTKHAPLEPFIIEDIEAQITEIKQQVAATYADFPRRADPASWLDIFTSTALERLEIKQPISLWLFGFLTDCYFIPKPIKIFLQNTFDWHDIPLTLKRHYPDHAVERTLEWLDSDVGEEIPIGALTFTEDINVEGIDRYYLYSRDLLFYASYQDDEEEIDQIITALTSWPVHDPELLCWLADYFYRHGKNEQASQYCLQLISIAPDQIDGHLRLAQISLSQRNLQQAITAFNKVLEKQEDHILALKGLASCFLGLGHSLEARTLYRHVATLVPYDVEARIQELHINSSFIRNDFRDLKSKPYSMAFCEEAADCYLQNGEYASCVSFIQALIARAKTNANPLFRLIKGSIVETVHRALFVKCGDFKEKSVSATLYTTLGEAYAQLNQPKQAEESYKCALDIATHHGENGYDARIKLARLLIQGRYYSESIDLLKQSLIYNENDSDVYFMLSESNRHLLRNHEAMEYINKAIEIDNAHWIYYSERSLLWLSLERYDLALPDLEITVRGSHSFADAWYRQGLCLSRLGRHLEAIKCFEEAIDWRIEATETALELLKSACHLGLLDKAKRAVTLYVQYGGEEADIAEWVTKIEQMKPQEQGQDA